METKNKIALYPGSFDALTFGHLDLIERSSKLFDKVIVGVAINDQKQTLFTPEERIEMIKEATTAFTNLEIVHFKGLTVNFADKIGAHIIIRGLRAISDYEYELQMSLINRELKPDIETIFLTPAVRYIFLSSRAVKEVLKFGGDISEMVPPHVEKKMREKFTKQSLFSF